jgi:hypothetical protein
MTGLAVPARLSALLAGPPPRALRLRTPVAGLTWVKPCPGLDRALPVGTSAAAQEGLRFERAVGKALRRLAPAWDAELFSGLWFRFHAASTGLDWAQPDHFLILDDRVLLLECKRTQTPAAWHQLAAVYAPLLAYMYELPVVGVQVAHYLVGEPGPGVALVPALRALALEENPEELAASRFLLHCHDPRRLG